MKLLGERQVSAAGTDGASMGPVGPIAVATHQAGGQYGLVWTECATDLGELARDRRLPRHAGQQARRRIGWRDAGHRHHRAQVGREAARPALRAKQVADLSVLLDEDLPVTWPGEKPGLEGARYLGKTLNAFDPARGPFFARMHILDSQAGTHLVTPVVCAAARRFRQFALRPRGRRGAGQI